MKNKRYKILVLSDLGKSSSATLKSSVSLAKMIDADIKFFNVMKPIEIVEKDNQLSAMRTINGEYRLTEKKIKNIINTVVKDHPGLDINYAFAFGNLKNEIEDCIMEYKPDVIVLGKRKSKPIKFMGDNIMQFVMDKHDGAIMVVDSKNTLNPNEELVLGLFNGVDHTSKLEFGDNLIKRSKKPLKMFKIVQNSDAYELTDIAGNNKAVEYVFEHNDNILKSLSNYLSKNNINLLCMDRITKNIDDISSPVKQEIKDIVRSLNISLLLTGNKNLSYNKQHLTLNKN